MKKYKLHDKLLDKITLETELSTLIPSKKDEPALIPISIPSTKNNLPNHSLLSSISYKSPSLSPILKSKKSIVKIEENNNIDSDFEIQPLSP